ncbi:hypothetical protein U9M48_007766 [Paspalum notatum var. saurae]|uniref:Uncharacterized protein n=1 Tax=Paspalum notatum var. saurae TaxID=547442 RepID=A0AAQ3SMX3_PASNO
MRRNQQHQKTRAADKAPRAWPGPPARPSPPLCRRARTPCVIAFPSPSSSPLPKFLFPSSSLVSPSPGEKPTPQSLLESSRRARAPRRAGTPGAAAADAPRRQGRPPFPTRRRRWCPGVYAIKYDTPVIDRSLRPVDSPEMRSSLPLPSTSSCDTLLANPATSLVVPAIGIIVFALWGFLPLMRDIRNRFDHGGNWKKSPTYLISSSYLQPLLLWTGATLICRGLDPIVLPSAASQAVKTRFVTFVRSLSTVLAVAYILTSLIQQVQKFLVDMRNPNDTRNMGFDFIMKALYTGIWIAAISLFMELLGFNTQKWITAGGFGTVLLTLAGREIFTNFLSSVMINATRPFVVNEWIDARIDGVEVSGTVEFIVADMRKVLAKNPQIEQQKLHRRVFFEKIDPKNQALMIYISCFVKTSHFEEYLNVQEAVMLDLLRIVGHHKARLATQIRTVQKSYGNADFDNIPFGEDMYSRVRGRPLLIDTSARISDDKAKPRPVSSREEQKAKTNGSVEIKSAAPENTSLSNSEKPEQKKSVPDDARMKNSKSDNLTPVTPSSDPVPSTSKTGKGKPHEPEATERQGDGSVSVANPKKESRQAFEDNIVLGVALEGSKRTLPIEEGNPYLSLSETEPDTVEAALSPKDKIGQSPKLSGQEKSRSEESR